MPYSYTNFTGDGSTVNRNIPFPYLDKEDIKVKVNGVDTAFTWISPSQIQISPASPNGAVGEIRRYTINNTQIVEFQDASVLTDDQLNLLATYDQYIAEEAADAQGQTVQLDSTGVFQGQNRRAANFADPVYPQDLTTKAYVDTTTAASAAAALASQIAAAASESNAAASESNASASATQAQLYAQQAAASANGMKSRSVRVAATTNIALGSLIPGAVVDGVTLAVGDRVLHTAHSLSRLNGIYVVQPTGSALRASDMDTWSEVVSSLVTVEEGTTSGDLTYLSTANQGGTLDTTPITFVLWQAYLTDGSVSTAKVANDAVTNAKLANMGANTIKVNNTASSSDPVDMSIPSARLLGRDSVNNLGALSVGSGAVFGSNTIDFRGLPHRGQSTFGTNTALDSSHIGRLVIPTAPITLTLPPATGLTAGDCIFISADASTTVAADSGMGTNVTSLSAGDAIMYFFDGGVFWRGIIISGRLRGTWTPYEYGGTSAGVGTYSQQSGWYVLDGDLVTAGWYINQTAHSGTGQMNLGGLPFVSAAGVYSSCSQLYCPNLATGGSTFPVGIITPGSSNIVFFQQTIGTGATTGAAMDASHELIGAIQYRRV